MSEVCEVDGFPLKVVVAGELMKCPVCGLYKRIRLQEQTQARTGEYAEAQAEARPAAKRSFSAIGEDLEIFITRVTEKLIPIFEAYPAKTKKILLRNREKMKKSLIDVIDGKLTFQKWFNNVHRDYGKHPVDLAQILMESTQGLNSPEARELRKGCEQYLQYITTMYNPQLAAGVRL